MTRNNDKPPPKFTWTSLVMPTFTSPKTKTNLIKNLKWILFTVKKKKSF